MKPKLSAVKDKPTGTPAATKPKRSRRDFGKLGAKPLSHARLLQLLKEEPAPPEFWDDPVDPFEPEPRASPRVTGGYPGVAALL